MPSVEHTPEVNDLSLLSLLAAGELERIQRQEQPAGRYLSALRDRLAEQMPGPGRADVKNIAPSTVQLYRRAIREATNSDPSDFPALVKELSQILEQLRLASETARKPGNGTKQDLGALLAFLISLHGQLLAQKQRSSSNRRSNRFRV